MKHNWRSRPARLPLGASPSSCKPASRSWGGSKAVLGSLGKVHSLILFTLPLCIIGSLTSILTSINTVTAQVTSDGTVSTTVITPDGKNFTINDGTTSQGNLFHSFREFSVPNGGSANFNNALDVQNIIGRVTGGSVSNIEGAIRALGKANLFLLNPAGIIFGPNASLNIGGSFLGSTANSFLFDNGFEFSATNPQAPPLLTINVPIGLGFRDNPQNITTQSAVLNVPQGNSLALVGGNVSLDGGGLLARGGRIELGGLSTAGTVGLNSDGSLSFPVGVQRGDVSLTNGALINVFAGGGGNIAVNARNLELSGGSILGAGIQPGLGTPGAQAGDIKIDATDRVRIEGTTNSVGGIINSTGNFSSDSSTITEPGNAGNITINTGTLEVNGNIIIASATNGEGNAGRVNITAKDKVSLTGDAAISNFALVGTFVGSSSIGNGADIVINTPSISLFNNAGLISSTAGQGNAGNIQVKASESIFVSGASRLEALTSGRGNAGNIVIEAENAAVSFDGANTLATTAVAQNSTGKGGDITIKGRNISVTNGAQLNASTLGQGNAGNVSVRASDSVELAKGYISSSVGAGGVGNGGNININAATLSLFDGAQLAASTFGQGNAGNVSVRASDSVELAGSNTAIFSSVEPGGVGKGGNININAATLSLKDSAQLVTVVRQASNNQPAGRGDAGNVTVDVTGPVTIAGSKDEFKSGIRSYVDTGATGNGGNITISSGEFSLTDGAQLAASTLGQGNAGNVSVRASDSVELANNGYIFSSVEAGGVGNGGNININAATLSLFDGGQLVTSVREASNNQPAGSGNAGNVTVDVTGKVTIARVKDGFESGIYSQVNRGATGNGGNITISSGSFSLTDGALLTASSSGNGAAGDIKVQASSIRLDNNSFIKADTVGGQGNINLSASDYVLLRRGSKITTNATGKAAGGNITINAGNLVAFPSENSDITAKAEESFGGRININIKGGIFGIEYRSQETPFSDITASSALGPQFSGTVQINTPEIDPTQGLFELTETVVDPAQQIAQNPCIKGFGSTFTITGRGGFPTDPNKILSSDNVRVDLIKPVPSTVSSTSTTQKQPSKSPTVKKITPARGWIYNEKGQVVLVGYDPTKTGPQREQPAPTSNCAAVK